MTETAKIAANNAYQRQLAAADAEYDADMTELNNYVRTEAKAEQNETYNAIVSAVQNGEYNTTADLEKYLGITTDENGAKVFGDRSIAAGLSDFQKANLLNMYRTRANDPKQQEADKAALAKSYGIATGEAKWLDDDTYLFGIDIGAGATEVGDDLEVQIPDADNADLNVEIKSVVTDEDFRREILDAYEKSTGMTLKEGDVFGYKGEIYIYHNKQLMTLTGRDGSTIGDYDELYKHYYPNTAKE